MDALKQAIALFPAEFGLRAFPGKRFRIEPSLSFTSNYPKPGTIYLYTSIQEGDSWSAFCKGTPAELRREVVNLNG